MGNLIDLTNQIFGDYKVTGFDNSKGKSKYYWKVKCIYCGNEKSIASSSLKRNLGTSCCSKKQKEFKGYKDNLVGKKYGHLLILEYVGKKYSHSLWKCKCDCGNETIKSIAFLNRSKYLMCEKCMHSYTKKDNIKKEQYLDIPFKEIAYGVKKNKIEIQGDYAILNDKIKIDTKNLEKILSFKRYVSINSSGYPYIQWKGRELFIYRLIMNLPQCYDDKTLLIADHINGIRTDCTEQNLRICKKTKNAINCKIYKNNKSGYKEIFWNKRLNKWEVGIQYDKKNHYLGVYSNLEDAIKIRKDAEKKYFGKFLRKEGDLNNGLG